MPHDQNVARLLVVVDQGLKDANRSIQEQVDGKRGVNLSPAINKGADSAATSPSHHGSSASLARHPLKARPGSISRAGACRPQCQCACHGMQRLAIPPFVSQVLGRLVLEHAGIPGIGIQCDTSSCAKAQSPQVSAEYWFPLRAVWSRIVQFNVSYQANLGPSLQLRTLRLIPDSAPAVSFAISGNIGGLQELFGRGAASPCDVSETRGYSLMRVSTSVLFEWTHSNVGIVGALLSAVQDGSVPPRGWRRCRLSICSPLPPFLPTLQSLPETLT